MLTESSGLPDTQGPTLGPGVELGGRYVLEERLEHGRVGAVYKALDKQRTDTWGEPQHVALLVVPPHALRGAALLEGFKRAFSAVRALRHPHIAAVYDFDTAGETCFLTMEHVDGESLRNVMDSLLPETVSRNDAWKVVGAVGEALLYAHDAGIVHGDVRAENVIVAPRGQVKVLFSPACFAASAPFQADEREDVYGLAELAYELLVGQKPPLDAPRSTRRGANARRQVDGLSRRCSRALQAGLAGREERTRTIDQLLAGLELPRRRAAKKKSAVGSPTRGRGRVPRMEPALEPGTPVAPVARVSVATRLAATQSGRTLASLAATLVRRAAAAVLIMGAVLLGAVVLLRYGPADIGRTVVAAGGATVDSVGRYVVDPAYRGLSAIARSARDHSATPATGRAEPGEEPPGNGAPGASAEAEAEVREGRGASSGAVRTPAEEPKLRDEPEDSSAEAYAPSSAGSGEAEPGGPQARIPALRRNGAQPASSRPGAGADESPAGRAAPLAPGSGGAPFAFAEREIVATEGQTVVPVEIRRIDASSEARIVWWTSDETATAGDDYANLGRVVESFAPGQTSRTVFIPITNDSLPEPRESFLVHLVPVSADGKVQGRPLTARITIVDDD